MIGATLVCAPTAQADPAGARPIAGPCGLPSTADLIIWERRPKLEDSAVEVGNTDFMNCTPMLDTWKNTEPTGPGNCAKIALLSDNPGYDFEVRPAPPLKNVLDQVGDC